MTTYIRLLLAILALALAEALAGCSAVPTPASSGYTLPIFSKPTTTPVPTTAVSWPSAQIGPFVDSGGNKYSLSIQIGSITRDDGSTALRRPGQGNVYLTADMTLKNLGPGSVPGIVYVETFRARLRDGTLLRPNVTSAPRAYSCAYALTEILSPGEAVTACVVFEAPASGVTEIIFAPAFQYEGLKPGRYLSFPAAE